MRGEKKKKDQNTSSQYHITYPLGCFKFEQNYTEQNEEQQLCI
jgi:hypothetical protein